MNIYIVASEDIYNKHFPRYFSELEKAIEYAKQMGKQDNLYTEIRKLEIEDTSSFTELSCRQIMDDSHYSTPQFDD